MKKELPKAYEPNIAEQEIYNFWLTKNYNHSVADASPDDRRDQRRKEPFVIVIPPPNITGALHIGHALNNTLQDVLIRYARMKGYNALWVPGSDHGGIATQNVVERILMKEGKTRHDIGREKFLEFMWEWRKKTGDTILNQLHKLGCSCDWERTRFTMDEICSSAVYKAFIKLYNDGYIYRGNRIVNWCPRCHTALADIEVEYKEQKSFLWYIKYPLKSLNVADNSICYHPETDGSRRFSPEGTSVSGGLKDDLQKGFKCRDFIIVATTRPETMLGDTAVAVNPKDERYKNLVGQTVLLPLMNREIKIVADELVDFEFGTGAVKVTPSHDAVDFIIAEKHNLEHKKVINEEGKMQNVGKYDGLDRFKCREIVVADLSALNLIEKIEPYKNNVGTCYRCGTIIEPLISEQWFVKMDKLAKRAHKAISEDKVVYYPKNWKEHTLTWLENIKDWCISRQIWWGHRIPIWYCKSVNAKKRECVNERKNQDKTNASTHQRINENCPPIASVEKPDKCPNCGGTDFVQDEDVLDTWFSSALWPFSVFGWGKIDDNTPEHQNDSSSVKTGFNSQLSNFNSQLNYYYPTRVLVTGYEILYLWVARMIMMGLHFLDKVPYKEVFVHGIVRDLQGKKMSKSLGNVIDPLDIMAKYGTDALRFSLVISASAGKDIHLSEESFVSSRNFMNKLYNMSRFIMMNIDPNTHYALPVTFSDKLTIADEWIITELKKIVMLVNDYYEKYSIGNMARELYDFVWFKFCDWYIEIAKIEMNKGKEQKIVTMSVLIYVLETVLKLFHPIAPFFTEYIWQSVKDLMHEKSESVVIAKFPEKIDFQADISKLQNFELLKNIISEIRTVRNEFKIPQNVKPEIIISGKDEIIPVIQQNELYIKHLALVNKISYNLPKPHHSTTSVFEISQSLGTLELYILLEGIIDFEKEKTRLKKDYANVEKFMKSLEQKLSNEQFILKAPKEEVDKIKERYNLSKESLEKLKRFIFELEQ